MCNNSMSYTLNIGCFTAPNDSTRRACVMTQGVVVFLVYCILRANHVPAHVAHLRVYLLAIYVD